MEDYEQKEQNSLYGPSDVKKEIKFHSILFEINVAVTGFFSPVSLYHLSVGRYKWALCEALAAAAAGLFAKRCHRIIKENKATLTEIVSGNRDSSLDNTLDE